MRGSVDWQTAELVKVIFVEGTKKEDRVNPTHSNFLCVSSFKTMETYRSVLNNAGHWMKEFYCIKDFEQITAEHIEAYMLYKIEYYPSKQYLAKISAALGKLEIALKRYTLQKYGVEKHYDFQIRQLHLTMAKSLNWVYDGYRNRVYTNPYALIASMTNPLHTIGASIQVQGGSRAEGICLIKAEQLHGYRIDNIIGKEVGVIETKEKGGKIGDILVNIETYQKVEAIIKMDGKFKINYKAYTEEIRNVCKKHGVSCESSHGFRWTYAQRRVREYQKAGYSYEEALQGVSWEMKHFRCSVTEHYLG
ncbi:PRC-barrel domain-containing protein [Sulfuricurvum sp.]|uniref:PRC-barrel domain-containing protein n=1 Tax=Sulfuricurvum sp. TaxID=2025608 RepID=UPI00262A1A9B|nr:PRC-barrel domain-containing protein [Sulfuricurvum sp.]MDD4950521.1 PRC-barrel domain-containing protein [Sulfuricurvum sp.]